MAVTTIVTASKVSLGETVDPSVVV